MDSQRNLLEIELSESLKRRREELQSNIESLGEADAGTTFDPENFKNRSRELKALNANISSLQNSAAGMLLLRTTFTNQCIHRVYLELEKRQEQLSAKLSELRTKLEGVQNEQAEDSRGISKQQKNTERYLAKKQMLTTRKEECNNNIRDLGVLPEEAFDKYTNEKSDRVSDSLYCPWL